MREIIAKNLSTKVEINSKSTENCSPEVGFDDELSFVIGCPICHRRIAEAYRGSKAYVRCDKCSAELFYEVYVDGPRTRVCKGPKRRLA